MDELASAGEELLEPELKGDCLKHSSRNGLKHDTGELGRTRPHVAKCYEAKTETRFKTSSTHLFIPTMLLSLWLFDLLTFSKRRGTRKILQRGAHIKILRSIHLKAAPYYLKYKQLLSSDSHPSDSGEMGSR